MNYFSLFLDYLSMPILLYLIYHSIKKQLSIKEYEINHGLISPSDNYLLVRLLKGSLITLLTAVFIVVFLYSKSLGMLIFLLIPPYSFYVLILVSYVLIAALIPVLLIQSLMIRKFKKNNLSLLVLLIPISFSLLAYCKPICIYDEKTYNYIIETQVKHKQMVANKKGQPIRLGDVADKITTDIQVSGCKIMIKIPLQSKLKP